MNFDNDLAFESKHMTKQMELKNIPATYKRNKKQISKDTSGILTDLLAAAANISAINKLALLHLIKGSISVFKSDKGNVSPSTAGPSRPPKFVHMCGISTAISSANSKTSPNLIAKEQLDEKTQREHLAKIHI